MASGVREVARRVVVDSFLGTGLRNHLLRDASARESDIVSRHSGSAGLGKLNLNALRLSLGRTPDIDTFFVLGSGASVEELTSQHFSEISSQRSVGINTWPVHPFVPDILSFESVPAVGDGRDFPRNLGFLHREDIVDNAPVILVLRPKTEEELQHLSVIPTELRQSTYLYGRVTPVARREGYLAKDIDYFFSHLASTSPSLLLDSGASVVRMIVLGILLGFRRIVLVGVDLNGSGYFWEKNPRHLASLSGPMPANNQRGPAHETTLTLNRPFSVITMVGALDRYLGSHYGGRVEIASESSALSGLLAPMSWKS